MSEILVKGLEMPKCCYETDGQVVKPCDFLEVCRRKWGVNINALDIHSEACPLVALTSHGDLIDEDEFRQVIYREIRNHRKDEPITMILKGILWEMDNAPVIVEATNG